MLAEDKQAAVEFEKDVQAIFEELQKERWVTWHRFVDTKAARNIVASQPADFLFASYAGVFLVEVKASVEKPTLAKCKDYIRPSQIGHQIKWDRAGQEGYFLFQAQLSNTVEFWPAHTVINDLWSEGPEATCSYFDLKQAIIELLCTQ